MSCEHYRPLLSRYHDGELSVEEREVLREHLAGCAVCPSRLAAYRRMDQQLIEALAVAPRPDLRRAVLAATVHRPPVEASLQARQLRARRGQVLFGGLSGATVAGLIVLLLALASSLSAQRAVRHHDLAASGRVTPAAGRMVRHGTPSTATSPGRPVVAPAASAIRSAAPTLTKATLQHRRQTHVGPAVRTASPVPTLAATPARHIPRLDRAAAIHVRDEAPLAGGGIHSALWSHDGRSLLYLTDWKEDPLSHWYAGTLWRYSPSGSVRLARVVRDYDWSPDDRAVIYARQVGSPARRYGSEELHMVGADGRGDRVLSRAIDHANIQYFPDHIVATIQGKVVGIDPDSAAHAPLSGVPALSVADEDRAFFAFSAGEHFFAYQDGSGLRVWDSLHGSLLLVREPRCRFGEAGFHFSWDGRTLFFSTFDGRTTMLYRQDLDPLGPPQALDEAHPLAGPVALITSPSPDGGLVNFRTGANAGARSFLIDAEYGPAHLLLPPSGVGPVGWWSPDGTRLVYTSYRGDQAVRSAIARIIRD